MASTGFEAARQIGQVKAELLKWAVGIVIGRTEADERRTELAFRIVDAQNEKWSVEPPKLWPDATKRMEMRARKAEKARLGGIERSLASPDVYERISQATAVGPTVSE